jgi:hypothetical protein
MPISLLSKPLALPHESSQMMMTWKEMLRLLEMQTLFNKDYREGDLLFLPVCEMYVHQDFTLWLTLYICMPW